MNRFSQIRVSKSVIKFKEQMMEKYGLKPYKYDDLPTVFFGLYNMIDYKEFQLHQGKSIIVWCGSDSLKIDKYKEYLPKIKSVTNIAMSSFISEDLTKYDIPHIIFPITPTKVIKNLKTRGENIYFYGSLDNDFYGYETLKKIKDKIPHKIIITQKDTYSKEELQQIYESCFIGLRLTKHDGLPNTVCELGLMGRRCIYNGNLPNAIPYKNNQDIINIINKEFQNRLEDNSEIVDKMYNFLNLNNEWLYY